MPIDQPTYPITTEDLVEHVGSYADSVGSGSGGAPPFGLNVQDAPYSCTGLIGQLDAGTRINAAIEDANDIGDNARNSLAGGCQVIVPPGLYVLDVPLLYRSGVIVQGAGPKATVFLRKASTTIEMLAAASLAENSWMVRDCRFDGNRANQAVAATAVALTRGAYPTYDVPGYLAGPSVTGFVSAVFGGGDIFGLHNVAITNILGKGLTLTDQVSQLTIDRLYIWNTSDHGMDDNGVDNNVVSAHIGNCGRSCLRFTGANNQYGHLKLYESDALDEGWPAFEVTGTKANVELLEIQEATFSGIRVSGSSNRIKGRVDGCSDAAVILNGSANEVDIATAAFNAYQPTYLASFGTNAVGNRLHVRGRDWSVGMVKGDVVGNEITVNGSRG